MYLRPPKNVRNPRSWYSKHDRNYTGRLLRKEGYYTPDYYNVCNKILKDSKFKK